MSNRKMNTAAPLFALASVSQQGIGAHVAMVLRRIKD